MPLVSSRDRRSPGRVGRVTSADGRGPDSSGLAPGSREGRELVEEVEQHDDGDPDDPDGDREPVEVPFGDAGTPEAGRDPASEHVRQPSAAALVEQDQQGQEQAGEYQQHLEGDADCGHVPPPYGAAEVGGAVSWAAPREDSLGDSAPMGASPADARAWIIESVNDVRAPGIGQSRRTPPRPRWRR